MTEVIRLGWNEWQVERKRRQAVMREFQLDRPSRRKTAIGSQETRLTRAFDGKRIP